MGTPIGYQRVKLANGTFDIPIYAITDADVADKSFRTMTRSGVGCYDLVPTTALPNAPLRINTHKGSRAVRGLIAIGIINVNVNNFYNSDGGTSTVEDTTQYKHVSTRWSGTGLITQITGQLLPSKSYELSASIELTRNDGLADYVIVSLWNDTKKTYIAHTIVRSSITVGGIQNLKGTFSTGVFDPTDILDLEVFAYNGNANADEVVAFKLYKSGFTLRML